MSAGEVREAAQRLLEQQLHSQFPNARQCGGCGAGPVDHAACDDLTAHHGWAVQVDPITPTLKASVIKYFETEIR